MKKIKSITDVITNSSSEVFVVKNSIANEICDNYEHLGCIKYDIISDDINNYFIKQEHDAIINIINQYLIKNNECQIEDPWLEYDKMDYDWNTCKDLWHLYCVKNKELIQKAINYFSEDSLVFLNIEDKFDYDEYEKAVHDAQQNAIYSDYRH